MTVVFPVIGPPFGVADFSQSDKEKLDSISLSDIEKLAASYLTKKITGTTPLANATGTYSTGVTKSKILSVNVLVEKATGELILPNHGIQAVAPEYYFAYVNPDGNLMISLLAESTDVASRPFTCLITYEE